MKFLVITANISAVDKSSVTDGSGFEVYFALCFLFAVFSFFFFRRIYRNKLRETIYLKQFIMGSKSTLLCAFSHCLVESILWLSHIF